MFSAQPGIDPDNNFFSLGGHSLLAIQCLSRLRERVPLILSLSDFFENPTVHATGGTDSQAIDQRRGKKTRRPWSGCRRHARDSAARSNAAMSAQSSPRTALVSGTIDPDAPVYNEAEAVRLKGNLDIAALERAFNLIIERHEIFRATIEARDERPIAVVRESWPVKFKRINVGHLPADQREAELARYLVDEPRRPYRLDEEPGIRATVVELAAGRTCIHSDDASHRLR